MASYSTELSPASGFPRVAAAFGRFFSGITHGLNAMATARMRLNQFDELNAKSDAALAKMGLRREDIPRHVFRDLLAS